MNQWCYSVADNQPCLPEVSPVTTCHRRFSYVKQSQCLLMAAAWSSGYLYLCIILSPSAQNNSINLTTQGEGDSRREDTHKYIHLESILNLIHDAYLLTWCLEKLCLPSYRFKKKIPLLAKQVVSVTLTIQDSLCTGTDFINRTLGGNIQVIHCPLWIVSMIGTQPQKTNTTTWRKECVSFFKFPILTVFKCGCGTICCV